MYIVYKYCTVPEFINLTDSISETLKHKNLINGSFTMQVFQTKDDYFSYVRSFDYYDINGEKKNKFLEATMCSSNEARRHRIDLLRNRSIYRKRVTTSFEDPHCYVGYLTKDNKGKIIDMRNYSDELYAFDNFTFIIKKSTERRLKFNKEWEEKNKLWDKDHKLREGHFYWGYYRSISTTQERRYATIPEHKLLIRGRRSFANLPNSYDDIYFTREKNWKSRNRKTPHQWGVNKPKHMSTVKITCPWNYIIEYIELDGDDDGV